jgi:hypothetical protein
MRPKHATSGQAEQDAIQQKRCKVATPERVDEPPRPSRASPTAILYERPYEFSHSEYCRLSPLGSLGY